MAAHGMTAYIRDPDGAFRYDAVLFRRVRGSTLPADEHSVTQIDAFLARELPPVVRTGAPRRPHAIHGGQEVLSEFGGLGLSLHPVHSGCLRDALSMNEHDDDVLYTELSRVG